MEQLVTNVLTNLIQLGILAGGTAIITLVYHKIGIAKTQKIYNFTKIVAQAAEQIFGGKTGEDKKSYVIDLLTSKFKVSETLAEALVESAVKEINTVAKDTKLDTDSKTVPEAEKPAETPAQ